MARRSRDWNEGLTQDLRDQAFAREFLLAAMDEGVPIQVALGKVIRAIGVKEFAAKVKMAGPNVLRAINPRHHPTQGTMNRFLKPFRLTLSLALTDEPRRRQSTCSDQAHQPWRNSGGGGKTELIDGAAFVVVSGSCAR